MERSDTTAFLARALNRCKRTIQRICGEPHATTSRAERSGNPTLPDADQKQFAEYMKGYGPVHDSDLPAIVLQLFGVTVSASTARRYLERQRLRTYSTQEQPPIRARDLRGRKDFASTITSDNISSFVFIDECTIGHRHIKAGNYWGEEPGLYYVTPIKSNIRSNVIGAVTSTSTLPLTFPPTTVNSNVFARYLDNLLSNHGDGIRYIVMDNVRLHGAAPVLDVLYSHQVHWIRMPPYSPDLNPIEHMWAYLKARLDAEHLQDEFKDVPDLDQAARQIWHDMKPDKVMANYLQTLQSIINSDGQYTGG